ncbi:hypothetical protein C8J56DRAFT_962710, partial [Mycena floridula]
CSRRFCTSFGQCIMFLLLRSTSRYPTILSTQNVELYEKEIARVSEILRSLRLQRQMRQNDALTFKAALSPIHRVPMELCDCNGAA